MKIAITGGIGSGKSTVSEIIKSFGYSVYSCDEIYKDIVKEEDYLNSLKLTFGERCVKDGVIDRAYLSSLVFSSKENVIKLNCISHPLIMDRLISLMKGDKGLSFAEVPLLFEGGFESMFDGVIIVYRSLNERIRAVMERDGTTYEKVLDRINNQVDYGKLKNEGYMVVKNTDMQSLKDEVRRVLNRLEESI